MTVAVLIIVIYFLHVHAKKAKIRKSQFDSGATGLADIQALQMHLTSTMASKNKCAVTYSGADQVDELVSCQKAHQRQIDSLNKKIASGITNRK